MKKWFGSIMIFCLLLSGCGGPEQETQVYKAGIRDWAGEITLHGEESEDDAKLVATYTGENADQLTDAMNKLSFIQLDGELSKEFDGLPSDGKLIYKLSNDDLIEKFESYNPVAVHVQWTEGDAVVIESLQFSNADVQ
ncbi:hypothetical protein CQS04_12085 [Chryseomicrobium excrementi]|uniref:Uncharacterized protein n=1 Tax=Chryseomicrobium excrementi TaxID=2041346 RepID=A0A2M9EXM8_9BACL|nr:hypothetical protein [Chryseomicrobium excrementi]PJK15966.1 hypothetical protein CQS04_12085 [Chryseomicrobium excrementi]